MNILDRRFKYVPSHKTDLKKRFDKIRAEQRKNAEEREQKVQPMRKVAK